LEPGDAACIGSPADHTGLTVTEEYAIGGGKTVDPYGMRSGETIIIEIETGKGDIPGNHYQDRGGASLQSDRWPVPPRNVPSTSRNRI